MMNLHDLPSRGRPAHACTLGPRLPQGLIRLLGFLAVMGVAVAGLAGCQRPGGESVAPRAAGATGAASGSGASAAAPTLSLGSEDLLVMGQGGAGAGWVVTGSLQAERRADLRAEVGSVVLRVLKDNGERVRRGELLIKLDDATIRDSLASAEESERAALRSLEGAERQYQRLKSLQAQGMTSQQALEDSEVRRNLANSERVAAQARVAAARQQLERTEVRAPFDGVVSARKVSAGDTAGLGKELVQVIDPSSVRFDAFVAAEQVAGLQVGQTVTVRVQGREATPLQGRVRRIDAVAQPLTRQVAVIVDLPASAGLIPGLYAEGVVAAQGPKVLALPDTAVVRRGEQALVWRLQADTVALHPVQLAPRDARSGLWPVVSGLAEGDRVLRAPGSRPVEGQKVTMRTTTSATSAGGASANPRQGG